MRNFSDEELKKWLAEEYNKEIDEMEKIMFPDGNIPDDGETEEEARAAYARLVERLKADGIYEEENDSENADDHKENNEKTEETEKVKIVYLPAKPKKRNRIARVAAAVLVCTAGVFAASMTSQANRSYFIDSVRLWTGNDTSISIDNDGESDIVDRSEQAAIDNIKSELNIDVPKFIYRPENFDYKDYSVNSDAGYAVMEYFYENTIVMVYLGRYDENTKSTDHILDGKVIDTIKLDNEEITINIKEVKDKNDKKENYIAYWKRNSVFYQISGKMEKKEFITFIKNIVF